MEMTSTELHHPRLRRWILLSILLHLIALLLFFFIQYESEIKDALNSMLHKEEQQQPMVSPGGPADQEQGFAQDMPDQQTDDNDVAELKGCGGSFGAPVVFDQMIPETTDKQQDAAASTALDNNQPSGDTVDQQQADATDMQTLEVDDLHAEISTDDQPSEPTQRNEQAQSTDTDSILEHHELGTEPAASAQPKVPPTGIKKKRKKKKVNGSGKGTGKPTMNFAQLAQGFLDSLDEGGKDWLSRKGNPNKRPGLEEMKYLSYTQKVAWYLQQAWRIDPPHLTSATEKELTLLLSIVIDKEGNLKMLHVNKPTGIEAFDEKIIKGVKSAGPFPPLPNHFNADTHTINFGVIYPATKNMVQRSRTIPLARAMK